MRQEAIPIRFVWLRTWGPVALWIALILTMSGEQFGADYTKRWLAPIFLFVFPDIQLGTLQTFHLLVRKAAHVIEYGVLGVLASNAFRQHLSEWAGVRRVLVTLVLAVGCAAVDEGHQRRQPGPTGQARCG